jgi:hypothetical protein
MGHDNGSFPNRHSSIYIVGEAPKLRSWVQIPPGPLFPVVQLRYYFELNLDDCQTNSAAIEHE